MERDDIESYMPAAGSIMPGQNKTAYSRGPNVDVIFKWMDY